MIMTPTKYINIVLLQVNINDFLKMRPSLKNSFLKIYIRRITSCLALLVWGHLNVQIRVTALAEEILMLKLDSGSIRTSPRDDLRTPFRLTKE